MRYSGRMRQKEADACLLAREEIRWTDEAHGRTQEGTGEAKEAGESSLSQVKIKSESSSPSQVKGSLELT